MVYARDYVYKSLIKKCASNKKSKNKNWKAGFFCIENAILYLASSDAEKDHDYRFLCWAELFNFYIIYAWRD